MKKLIAFDIVLIPPKELMDISIDLSKSIIDSRNEIKLNLDDCIPHITLAMGCTTEDNIGKIRNIMQKIAGKYSSLNLKVIGIKTGEIFSALEIEKSNELQNIHEEILKNLDQIAEEKAEIEAFAEPSAINKLTLNWVDNFKETSCFEKYWPHITLGYGEVKKKVSIPIEFTASLLGLYQLGVFCTCKKNIQSIEL